MRLIYAVNAKNLIQQKQIVSFHIELKSKRDKDTERQRHEEIDENLIGWRRKSDLVFKNLIFILTINKYILFL